MNDRLLLNRALLSPELRETTMQRDLPTMSVVDERLKRADTFQNACKVFEDLDQFTFRASFGHITDGHSFYHVSPRQGSDAEQRMAKNLEYLEQLGIGIAPRVVFEHFADNFHVFY